MESAPAIQFQIDAIATCTTPEASKAWSQNLGHHRVLPTLTSYGTVAPYRKAELIKAIGKPTPAVMPNADLPAKIAIVVANPRVID